VATETETKQLWVCTSCGFVYDPDEGDPDGGIPPGTPFTEIPDTWFCPVCGARSERARTTCHAPMRHIKGWTWLDNDGVNLAATVLGGGLGMLGSLIK